MSVEAVRQFAMSLPHATEQIQWVDHLLFKVGGKMFAIVALSPEGNRISLKSTPEKFYELTEIPGVVPAPYMARNHWIALESWDAVRSSELRELVKESYDLVFAKLPKKTQAQLASKSASPKAKPAPKKKTLARKRAAR
ncbi:MAG TPA: MmcQ/YjbR family DNA-binding protein [Terriglobales bacterium]|nr:MmcQ/YjbR family DNA-binding protein [Terriglobales bacterium]